MTKKSDAPAIRFKGFSDAWEQRKAIDIADYSKGNGYSKGDLADAGTPIILYGRLYTKYQFAISEVDTFAVPRNGAVYSQGNEVIVPASGETAEDIARASAVEKSGVLLGGDLNILRPFDFMNPLFLALAISNGEPQKELAKKAQGKSVVHIHNTDIQEVTIVYPSKTEQDRIVSVFRQLDNLITLHQRKCISFTGRAGRLISTVNKKRITSSWEQRKFSDITFPAGEKNRDNLPLESYSITNEHGFVPQDEKFENGGTMREADKRMYYIVSPNSFAYNPARINVGSIGYQNIGKNVIVSSLYEVFKTSEDVDDRLLWHWFKSPDFQKLIMQLQEGGVRLYFYYDKLCMGEVSLPSLEEQRKIGKLFDTLDNLITLHQRKFEKLTNVKKSMLEKMFPQNGSSYPEIRFKGFTDPWEQRKLCDVVKEITRNDPESEAPIMMITANNGFIEQSERYAFNNAGESLKKYILLKKGELAYNHGASKLRPYGSCFALTTAENARIPFVYHCFSAENQNAEFMSIELNGAEIENQLRKIVSSGARMDGLLNISFDEYTSVSVLLPGIEEQDCIADFFRQLDNLITLHQRELEKLQNIKKSMLEKMFV